LLPVETLGVANRRDGSAEVPFDFVANMLRAIFVFLYRLTDGKVGTFETVVGNQVAPEIRVHSRAIPRAVPVRAGLGLGFRPLSSHSEERALLP
jgi:hypothetical protein